MTEILFYHMTDSTLEAVLPGLLERSLERGWRAVVQTGGEERRDALDLHLWTFRENSFLAHGLDSDPHAAEQPIALTTSVANPNGAAIRFMVDNAEPVPSFEGYQRGVFLFDGHDQGQLEAARAQWKKQKGDGHAVSYWRQAEGGRWEKQA